ncbi:MAG TPA: hypothetical protein PLD46_00655 [Hyphomicrobium sp.]|nr:hypothetical protein [Hyphomicrobium sp.]
MIVDTQPAFARRIRLSTAGIFVAFILTCAALLAIAVAVGPSDRDPGSSVSIEGPVSTQNDSKVAPASLPTSLVVDKLQAASSQPALDFVRR